VPKIELELAGLKLAGVLEQGFLLLPVAAVLAGGGVLRPEPASPAGPQVAPAASRPPPPPPHPRRATSRGHVAPSRPPGVGACSCPGQAACTWQPTRGQTLEQGQKEAGHRPPLNTGNRLGFVSVARALRPSAAHFCIAARTGPAVRRCRPPPQLVIFLVCLRAPCWQAHVAVLLSGRLLRSPW